MEEEIIVTRHALEEYLNDNPKEKYPKIKLKCLYHSFKNKVRYKQAKWWHDYIKEATVIRYNNEAIVFNDKVIITYYRIISLNSSKLQNKIINKFKNILNWKKEEQIRAKEIRKFERQMKKTNKYSSKNNAYKYNSQLGKCFNTR